MTRPDEPTEALPTRALPITGDADAAEPTVHLTRPRADADATMPLAVERAEPTARLAVDAPAATDGSEPTVQLSGPVADDSPPADPATQLSGVPSEDDPTADLAASATPTPPGAEQTVHRQPDRADEAGEATVHLRTSAGEPTVSLCPAPAHPTDEAATVHLRPGNTTGQATVHPRPTPGPTQRSGAEPTASWQPTTSWQPTGVPPRHQATGPAATGAGAYPDRTGHARAASGGPAPGGELRFGPGVPGTPPPAPPWPTAPPIRPRPVWRRVVSVLSTLLTVVLLLAVGLYLWQRLRPLEVEGVTVAVPRPAGVACDVTVDVVATVRTNGRGGTIRYQWFRSDAPPGAVLTERVGSGQQTAALTLKWTFTGVGTTTGIATVNIVEPTTAQASTRVVYRCPGA
ncbi:MULTISPECIES: hypothetical protein [unclassified Micromonospora]|uniref:hypothetical protein n=1 Tax=Micromonospora TaxID=1873 RepID=UPI002FF13A98